MGRVDQISVSEGGVPKLAVESAVIDDSGVVGDAQADRVHHGHADQALCLFSLEVIEGMQAEGHPIEPGSAGENITVSGMDWGLVVPGTRMIIGDVEIEISGYTTPCAKNARWFTDGNYNRMHVKKNPGESRVYARVLHGGIVTTGAAIELVTQ